MYKFLEVVGFIVKVLFFVSALYLIGDVVINMQSYLHGNFTPNCYQGAGLGCCFVYGVLQLGTEVSKKILK